MDARKLQKFFDWAEEGKRSVKVEYGYAYSNEEQRIWCWDNKTLTGVHKSIDEAPPTTEELINTERESILKRLEEINKQIK